MHRFEWYKELLSAGFFFPDTCTDPSATVFGMMKNIEKERNSKKGAGGFFETLAYY